MNVTPTTLLIGRYVVEPHITYGAPGFVIWRVYEPDADGGDASPRVIAECADQDRARRVAGALACLDAVRPLSANTLSLIAEAVAFARGL